jgi:hypothetical protein
MMNELHLAIYREPVGMNVQRTHEYGDHKTFIMEIFVFLSLFNDNNLSIGRSYYKLIGISIKITDWTTIEIECHKPGCSKNEDKNPKRYRCTEVVPKSIGDATDSHCADKQLISAFSMDPNFLQFLNLFSHG